MDIIIRILQIVGSLGLFLFGIKLMSEALQRLAGDMWRRRAGRLPAAPLRQTVAAGALAAATVQSSGAVSVAVVSGVNAGFLPLRPALGLLLGAGIGATLTAWLVALLGFWYDLSSICIPLVGLGFVLILVHRSWHKSLGGAVIGFALMLFGLAILRQSFVGGLANYTEFIAQIETYARLGYWSLALFVLVGALLAAALQSANVTVVMAMILGITGWIPMDTAAAMVLGANVGSTLTANIAAVRTHTDARRTALAHTVIKVLGLVWALPLLPWLMGHEQQLFDRLGMVDAAAGPALMLALFHTGFNVVNALILGSFVPQIGQLVRWFVPPTEREARRRLFALDTGLIATPELSLIQARGEIVNHAKRVHKMFGRVRGLMSVVQAEAFEREYAEVARHEELTDRLEKEIVAYLSRITSHDNGPGATRLLQSLFRTVSHIELIGDCNMELADILRYKKESKLWINQEYRDKVSGLFDLVDQALYTMIVNLERPTPERIDGAQRIEDEINLRVGELRGEQLQLAQRQDYKYLVGITFLELLSACEQLANSAIHISAEQRSTLA